MLGFQTPNPQKEKCFLGPLAVVNRRDNYKTQSWVSNSLFVSEDLSWFYLSKVSTHDLTCSSFWIQKLVTHVMSSVVFPARAPLSGPMRWSTARTWHRWAGASEAWVNAINSKTKHHFASFSIFWVQKEMKLVATTCLLKIVLDALERENSKNDDKFSKP